MRTFWVTSTLCIVNIVVAVAQHCDVYCKPGTHPTATAGDYICNEGFPQRYEKKATFCTVRLSVNKYRRVRLTPTHFNLRVDGPHCTRDYIRFDNRYNTILKSYTMEKVCNKNQFHSSGDIIINSPQVRLVFRVDPKYKKGVSGKKWRFQLKDYNNPNVRREETCAFTMEGLARGFNQRSVNATVDGSFVFQFCCTPEGLNANDDVTMACEKSPTTWLRLTAADNGDTVCTTCSPTHTSFSVEADINQLKPKTNIGCVCNKQPIVGIGGSCSITEGCTSTYGRVICNGTTCVCPSPYTPSMDNKYCTKDVGLGEDCSTGETCSSTYGRAICDGTTCVCPATFAPDNSNTYCTKDVPISDDCSNGLGCIDSLNRATCQSNICKCPTGMSPSASNAYCTRNSAYNQACDFTEDCTATRSKQCNTGTGKCVCESPFTFYKSICSYKSTYRQQCEFNDDCAVTNSKCIANKCECLNSNYKQKSATVCAPICKQKNNKWFAGSTVCNKKKGKCFKCKCENPPAKLQQKASNKKFCKGAWKCQKVTTIGSGNNCGS